MPVLLVLILFLLGIANAVETPNSIQCDGKFTYSLASLHCLMHNDLVVVLSVMALLVLPPLALASFLCCNPEQKTDPSISRRLSRKERKSLASSKDVSINITDIDNPLGSDHFTTFHKIEDDKSTDHLVSSQSVPSLIDGRSSINTTDNMLESSLDIGIRPESRYAPSLSSMISLGPRVPPEGSSLLSLSAIEKPTSPFTISSSSHIPTNIMPPPPTIPPPPSHLRQHSTPISLPSPSHLPPQKSRPLTIIGHPSQESPGTPNLSPKAQPTLSPVSLTESEALVPTRTGQVQPYRVVHQPSPSLSSLSNLPHSSDGILCTHCGAKLTNDPEPLHLVESTSEHPSTSDEICQQCQVNDPHYLELDISDDDTVCSPPPSSLQCNASPEIDPLYERIGSIRRQHMTSIRTTSHASDDGSNVTTTFHPKPPALPSAFIPSNRASSKENKTCTLPPEERYYLLKCQLPSEGAPLPPRPPTLGLLMEGSSVEHNYESLPSTFGIESPQGTLYARISSPEEEADTPPYVPENSERAHMLKIDSQGYAEVVHGEENDETSNLDSERDYSPLDHAQFSNRHAMASDYEVPVRIAPLSPSLLHSSPTHTKPSPIPVPTPLPPSSSHLNVAQPPVPLPSEHKTTTAAPPLTRQQALSENPLPLHARSLQPARSLRILPQGDSQQDTRRDSSDSTASYHLTFRFSTTSSGLGESMTESLRAITEEELEKERETSDSRNSISIEPAVIEQKIYEVENRSRTKSYPDRGFVKSPVPGVHKHKAQTMHAKNVISFNEDSQTV